MFVLDTNVVSALRKIQSDKSNPLLAQWAGSAAASDLYLSVITIMELEIGVLQMERRDGRQGAMLRGWLDKRLLPEFTGRILPIDADVAHRCAYLHVPDRQNERDALIAATALVHGMTVVTRNVADFVSTGVSLLNPWDDPS